MKTASLNEIKIELASLRQAELIALCLRLARFKKENKELLTFLLFDSADLPGYLTSVKTLIDEQFALVNKANLYLAKKSLRKILRMTNQCIRHTLSKQVEVELLIYYCFKLRSSGIPVHKSVALTNLFTGQLKKINKQVKALHEDLQYDFQQQLGTLE